MKQFRFCKKGWMQAALLLLISLAIFTACKKDKLAEEKEPECRIITISYSPVEAPNNIKYDDKGRLKTIVKGNVTMNYSYNKDTTVILKTLNGAFRERIIVVANSKGLPRSVKSEGDIAGTLWYYDEYEYNGDEMIKRTTTSNSFSTPTIFLYEWRNGNPVKYTQLNLGWSTIMEYDESIPHQPGDYHHSLLLTRGYEEMRPKNALIKSGNQTYSYSFDSDGKITGITTTYPPTISNTTTYQYQCN